MRFWLCSEFPTLKSLQTAYPGPRTTDHKREKISHLRGLNLPCTSAFEFCEIIIILTSKRVFIPKTFIENLDERGK